MDQLRKVPFIIAIALMAIVVAVEIGAGFVKPPPPDVARLTKDLEAERVRAERPPDDAARRRIHDEARHKAEEIARARATDPARPGLGIPYLAFIDGILLFIVAMMGLALVIPPRVWGRVHGAVRFVAMLAALAGAVFLIPLALVLLLLMFGLFVAAPFGTLAYLALWGSFDRGGAQGTLALLLSLKLAFAVLLVVAQQRHLAHKGLVLLVLTSLLGNAVVAFLHGFVPGVLVSITDALAAIIVGVLGAVWAIVMLVGSVVTVVKSIRLERSSA